MRSAASYFFLASTLMAVACGQQAPPLVLPPPDMLSRLLKAGLSGLGSGPIRATPRGGSATSNAALVGGPARPPLPLLAALGLPAPRVQPLPAGRRRLAQAAAPEQRLEAPAGGATPPPQAAPAASSPLASPALKQVLAAADPPAAGPVARFRLGDLVRGVNRTRVAPPPGVSPSLRAVQGRRRLQQLAERLDGAAPAPAPAAAPLTAPTAANPSLEPLLASIPPALRPLVTGRRLAQALLAEDRPAAAPPAAAPRPTTAALPTTAARPFVGQPGPALRALGVREGTPVTRVTRTPPRPTAVPPADTTAPPPPTATDTPTPTPPAATTTPAPTVV